MVPGTPAFVDECKALGQACAQARMRLDERGPGPYQAGFRSYDGPKKFPSYFARKCLSLRLSAVKRGMLVDPTVTPEFLELITNGRCPVTLEELDIQGKSPQNPSVDRLVNEVTYLAGNICVLSMRANRAKGEKTFEEVAALAQAGEPSGGLEPLEWMRLASLMYGAWARAIKQGDPHLLPLAAIPGRGMFMSTSQVVQLLLTRFCQAGAGQTEALARWLELTQEGGGHVSQFQELQAALYEALAEEDYPGDAWLHAEVFNAFVGWFNACHRAVIPFIERLLHEQQERRADPVARLLWPTTGRYHH